jgi:hypothetical protein
MLRALALRLTAPGYGMLRAMDPLEVLKAPVLRRELRAIR